MFVKFIFSILVIVFANSEAHPKKNHSASDTAQVRIVGGKPAKQGDFPYQVYLLIHDEIDGAGSVCSGTLISNQYVLTAAHCVTSSTNSSDFKNNAEILLGTTNRGISEEGRKNYTVPKQNFIRHPNYKEPFFNHDIALIKLPEPVEFSKYIQPAHLPSSYQTEKDLIGKTIITSGWGVLHVSDDNTPDILQYMKTNVLAGDECHREFPSFITFTTVSQICIHSPTKTFCDGDSGGPNVVRENGVNTIVGVSAVAFPDCDLGKPQILEKVSYYLGWISQNTGITV